MSIKWTIGAVIAVLSAMLVLPGVASAHHPEVNANVECDDGTFVIDADYIGGTGDRHLLVFVEDERLRASGNVPDAGDIPDGMTGTIDENNGNFNWSNSRDKFEADSSPGFQDFFVLEGDYDSVDALDDDEVTVRVNMYNETNNNWNDLGSFQGSASNSVSTDDFWSECGLDVCVDGDTGVEQLSFDATPTGDCDPVRLCVDGDSVTVTEFAAESLDGEKGSCTPSEDPPETTTTVTETEPEPEPVEEVQEAVAEVSPAIEVVALPSAGFGEAGGINYIWAAISGLAVIGFAGATALMARPRR